jgi:hypothetical protein
LSAAFFTLADDDLTGGRGSRAASAARSAPATRGRQAEAGQEDPHGPGCDQAIIPGQSSPSAEMEAITAPGGPDATRRDRSQLARASRARLDRGIVKVEAR